MLIETVDDQRVEFVCAGCGYGIVVTTTPPTCPMCGASTWDLAIWQAFGGLGAPRAARDG